MKPPTRVRALVLALVLAGAVAKLGVLGWALGRLA